MIPIDVLVKRQRFNPDTGMIREVEVDTVIYVNLAMGIRLACDDDGQCWISLSDNSVWKAAHDIESVADQIKHLSRLTLDELIAQG